MVCVRSEEGFCGKADDGPGIVRYRPLTNPLPLTTPASAPFLFVEPQQKALAFVRTLHPIKQGIFSPFFSAEGAGQERERE